MRLPVTLTLLLRRWSLVWIRRSMRRLLLLVMLLLSATERSVRTVRRRSLWRLILELRWSRPAVLLLLLLLHVLVFHASDSASEAIGSDVAVVFEITRSEEVVGVQRSALARGSAC